MGRRLAIAAASGKAADASNRMTQSKTRRKCVPGSERGHVVLPDVPDRGQSRPDQSSRENAASLQGGKTENLARVSAVEAPIIDNVKNLRAHDPAEHHQNSQIPGVLGIDPLLL